MKALFTANKICAPVDQFWDKINNAVYYNPEMLKDYGWCEIAEAKNGEWGICSPSCGEVM